MGRVLFTGAREVPLCQCPHDRQEVRSSGGWSLSMFLETGPVHTLPAPPTQLLPFSGDQLKRERLEREEELNTSSNVEYIYIYIYKASGQNFPSPPATYEICAAGPCGKCSASVK